MEKSVISEERPLAVAIIGSGPSGFYAAEALIKSECAVEVDMFEYLPTPYGLVRAGVAPDHQNIKAIAKIYDKIAHLPEFRFWGNVEFGKDITKEELQQNFDIIIYAIGAQSDRSMGIEGEELAGSHSASEFVAWYNGHPDHQENEFDLSAEKVTIIGMGNVALDIARILALTPEEVAKTDIPHHVQKQLSHSKVKEINIIARRGPMQAAFTKTGIKEIPHLTGAVAITDPHELKLEAVSQKILEETNDKRIIGNLSFLQSIADNQPEEGKRVLNFIFRRSPKRVVGSDKVEGIEFVKNELFEDEFGKLTLQETEALEHLDSGLIFRSIGYRVKPINGIEFDPARGTIANDEGRVIDAQHGGSLKGEYVVGWAKRGASGVIGTNKPDSIATVEKILEDYSEKKQNSFTQSQKKRVETLLDSKEVHYVPFEDWKILDEVEKIEGEAREKPREKITTVAEMISIIKQEKLG